MKAIVFALPPLAEQETILEAFDTETRDLLQAIQQARREIHLLREYRTRLIADVVTGKVDVRGAAARLPDQVGESEPHEEAELETDAESVDELDTLPASIDA